MPTPQNHTINIDDTTANWLNWGNLVLKWVNKQQTLPKNVGELKAQWAKEPTPIQGKINSPDARGLNFVVYSIDPRDAITIPLPDPTMVQADNDTLRKLTNNGMKSAPYPLQSFYPVCFGGAPEANLSLQEMLDMEARRIGEYVINECM